MSNEVQFDFDTEQRPQYLPETSKLVQFAMKYSGGYVKDEQQANYFLFGFAVLAVIISFLLFWGGKDKLYMPSQQEIQRTMPLQSSFSVPVK